MEALGRIGRFATARGVTVAFEPVNHEEIGWHNTIASAASTVRRLAEPGLRLMVDTFHMNIEERDMLTPLAGVADILVHVHLSETNRDVLARDTGRRLRFCGSLSGSSIPALFPSASITPAAHVGNVSGIAWMS